MSASRGAWECRHGVDGRDWCGECHSGEATRPWVERLGVYLRIFGKPISGTQLDSFIEMAQRREWQGVYPGHCVNPEVCRGLSHCPRDYSCVE